MQTTLREINLV